MEFKVVTKEQFDSAVESAKRQVSSESVRSKKEIEQILNGFIQHLNRILWRVHH